MPFRLLDLPPELWSHICALALSTAYPSTLYLHEDMHARTLQALTRQPALLRTCRAVRAESLPLLYARAVFLLIEANMYSPNWKRWLGALAPDTRRYMSGVFVTSTHQDLVTHMLKEGLLPEGAVMFFAEPTGHDSLPLGDFTYRVVLPVCSEAVVEREGTDQGVGLKLAANTEQHVRRQRHSYRKLAMSNLWQARRGGPAKGRWLMLREGPTTNCGI
ncbi:hypothetical protein LTR53_011819 [Teratosphaeriaceae sp. CCFEE 6253]|nr:hypothetical protein LTR53_011819 [Teratosphaeriaceae sp. CCFEE 6253]